jgi:hypothetical protein
MRQLTAALLVALALAALPGCIAKTMVGVVTAPVRVAGKAVDLTTTSQSEADEKRGRAIRRSEERLGRLERDRDRHSRQCAQGDDRACELAEAERAELDRNYRAAPLRP